LVFATQSTHKLLAGLSQASQILVQDGTKRKLDTHRFNESYLMHSSTSPQYAIIASCDVAAAMMEPPGGKALVEESILEALDFRRAMRKVDADYGDDWWFRVWGPEALAEEGIGDRDDWVIHSDDSWHGFGEIESGFNMLDPIKATIITPGLDVDGNFDDFGIPASIVSKYLAEHGIIIEKSGMYSFFIMFTIGITKGRWNSMVTELQQFKDDYDQNLPLWRVMPQFAAKYPQYDKVGLRDLCSNIHNVYKEYDLARITTEMYLSEMEAAMIPAEAWSKMSHREVERVAIDELEGRITAMLVTPYPPGIPLLIPGERFNKTIVKYLQFVRDFNSRFPGFETDCHGLVKERVNGVDHYFVDVVNDG
jgi:arginine decarboxylase